MGRHGSGGVYGQIKAFEFFPLTNPHIKEKFTLKTCRADMPYICWREHSLPATLGPLYYRHAPSGPHEVS